MTRNSGRSSQRPEASTSSSARTAMPMALPICLASAVWPPPDSTDTQGEEQGEAQVLKQADRHGEAPVGAVVLRLLGELGDDDGRRGHGHGAADHHGHGGKHAESQAQAGRHDGRGGQHLRAADPEHLPAHRHQAGQGEFQPQGEYQEYHAEIRQKLRGFAALSQRQCMRSQQHAHREISKNRGQLELAHPRDHAHRSGEQDQDL